MKLLHCAKDPLQSDALLTHFNLAKLLILACDASEYGLVAVLSHIVDGDKERLIACISRILSAAEKQYFQLQKEALSTIFAVKKFHCYCVGRHFTIELDYQPLKTLCGEPIEFLTWPPPELCDRLSFCPHITTPFVINRGRRYKMQTL